MTRIIANIALMAVTCAIAFAMGEGVVRVIDGYQLLSFGLIPVRAEHRPAPNAGREMGLAHATRLRTSADIAWYAADPARIPRRPPDDHVTSRLSKYPTDPYGAFFAWNRTYLRKSLCAGATLGSLGILNEFYFFDPTEDGIQPTYRHLPGVSHPAMFTPNAFGWRGGEVALNKPPGTIRIAFVGASTTVNGYAEPWSYPEHVGHWLNLWAAREKLPVRFEVINAGRTGIDSTSIAAIVRQELVPVKPDLVVYYEGANQFLPLDYVTFADGVVASTIRSTFRYRSEAERHSAIVARLFQLLDRVLAANGGEPAKPAFSIAWPADLDEANPSVDYPKLPLQLNRIVADLDAARDGLRRVDAELVVSSFVWLVHDGMKVDMRTNPGIYRYLNETYWPIRYSHMRRMADFQNRVFRNYAQARDLPFLDVAAKYPMEPALFGDAIHMTGEGVRLHAWIAFQELVPILRQRLDQGVLPRRDPAPLRLHPAFDQPREQMVTRAEIMAGCGR